jgi:hypothetical protein
MKNGPHGAVVNRSVPRCAGDPLPGHTKQVLVRMRLVRLIFIAWHPRLLPDA